MTEKNSWLPPKSIDKLFEATQGNQFANINRPTAGPREDKDLPVGPSDIQLYSLGTPNGQKVSVLLEELLEAGCDSAYDAHFINIGEGDQFTSGFVALNPNSKIPTALDKNGPGGRSVRLFESGSICLYLAKKFGQFIPEDPALQVEMMNWLFWEVGSQGPVTGQFGHFFVYAPDDKAEVRDYGVARYGMESQRLCDVIERELADKAYILGDEYSLADIMIFPWFNQLQNGYPHSSGIKASEFLDISQYKKACAWAEKISQRPGVIRGLQVCSWNLRDKGTKPWLND